MKTLDRKCVTTATELAGYRVIGNLSLFVELCERAPFRLRAYGACPSTLRAPSPLRRGRESNCFRFPRLSQGSNHLRCSFPCVAGDKTAGLPF
jgi:hypothetical protein